MVPAFSSYTAADAGSGGVSDGATSGGSAPTEPGTPVAPAASNKSGPAAARPSLQASFASQRKISSPYARKLARDAGVDIGRVQGSGPGGRVTAADVDQAVAAGGAAAASSGETHSDFTEEGVKQVQKVTARRLLESKTTVPHYYLTYECEVDKLLSLRRRLNDHLTESGGKVSVNDFIIKASAAALRAVPDVNSSWHGDFIRRYHNVDVSVAVQTPAGLMVPVVRDADLKGLHAISEDIKSLASRVCYFSLLEPQCTGQVYMGAGCRLLRVHLDCEIDARH